MSALTGSERKPLAFGGWEFWIASDGAICIDGHGESSTALSPAAWANLVRGLALAQEALDGR